MGEVDILLNEMKVEETLEKVYELTGEPKEKITGTVRILLHMTKESVIPRLVPDGSSIGMGRLNIKLREGRNLAPKDSNNLSDPFCIVNFEGRSKKTPVIKKTLFPVWDSSFIL